MADFKVDKKLTGEISDLRTTGNSINSSYAKISSGDVKTLKTAVEIIDQHADIKALLELYKSLVLRDAKDMDAFVAEAEKMDAATAKAHKT